MFPAFRFLRSAFNPTSPNTSKKDRDREGFSDFDEGDAPSVTFMPSLDEEGAPREASASPTQLKSPGSFENLTSSTTDVTEIDKHLTHGIELTFNNLIAFPSPIFQTGHKFALGKKEGVNPMTRQKDGERSSYTLFSTFQNKRWAVQSSWSRLSTLLMIAFTHVVETKMILQITNDPAKNFMEFGAGYTRGDFHCGVKNQNGISFLQYAQAITPSFAVGTELMNIPGIMTKHAVTLRHQTMEKLKDSQEETPKATCALTLESVANMNPQMETPQSIGVSHVYAVDKGLDFVTSLQLDYTEGKKKWDSKLLFGYTFSIDDGGYATATSLINLSEKKLITSVATQLDFGRVGLDTKVDYAANTCELGVSFQF